MSSRNSRRALILALALPLLAACVATSSPPRLSHPPDTAAPLPEHVRPGEVLDLWTGQVVPEGALMDRLARARVVYVAESHTSVQDHAVQQAVLEGLLARGRRVVLAMEMFLRSAGPVLEQWTAGKLTREEFVQASDWERVWGYPFGLYAGLLDTARERGVPVVGANAPMAVIRRVASSGFASLTPAERALVASELNTTNSRHKERLERQYGAHPHGSAGNFERFYEAQLVWEETMAETVAELVRGSGPETTVLLAAGSGHVAFRGGIPDRVARRTGLAGLQQALVLPVPQWEYEQDPGSHPPSLADYLWITDQPEEASGLRVGVALGPGPAGMPIRAVVPETPADRAGLRAGDLLLSVNGRAVRNMRDLHRALVPGGGVHLFLLERDHRVVEARVDIPPAPHGAMQGTDG